MNMIYTEAYRTAFDAYLRKGIPIRLTLKHRLGRQTNTSGAAGTTIGCGRPVTRTMPGVFKGRPA